MDTGNRAIVDIAMTGKREHERSVRCKLLDGSTEAVGVREISTSKDDVGNRHFGDRREMGIKYVNMKTKKALWRAREGNDVAVMMRR